MKRVILEWLPDYDIAENGEVRRITPAKTRGETPYVVHGSDDGRGYRRVKLMLPDGSKKKLMVASLVCEAFHGPKPDPAMHCAHWDGNSQNNNFQNLRWATPKENVGDDRIRHGRTPRGSKNGRCRVTERQVIEMRKKYNGNHGEVASIAREYGLSRSATFSILKGINWSWL